MKMFNLQAGQMQLFQLLITGQILQLLTILGDSTELIPVYRFLSCIEVSKLDKVFGHSLMRGKSRANHFRLLAPTLSIQPGMLMPFLGARTQYRITLLTKHQASTSFSTELYSRQQGPSLLCCSTALPSQVQNFVLALAELCIPPA